MKKLLLLITILLPALQSTYGQEQPWISAGKQWSTLVRPSVSPEYYHEWTTTSFLKSDTIINDLHYFNIYTTENEDLAEAKWSGLCIRQDGDKVYHYNTKSQQELLLFDFSKEYGDEFTYYDGVQVKVTAAYTYIDINGIRRRAINIVSVDGGGRDEWIEGFGSMQNGIGQPCLSKAGTGYKLLCCRNNKQQFYHDPDYKTCYRKTYPPFFLLTDHTKWREINYCDSNNEIPTKYNLHDYEVLGDTVINNQMYKKVYLTINGEHTDYYTAIREQNNILLCKPANSDKEYTLADYRWTGSEQLQFNDISWAPYEFECNITGQIESENKYLYDYIQLADHWGRIQAPSKDVRFIKYFGSTLGLFSYLLMGGQTIDRQMYNELVSIHIGNDLIYQNPYFTEDGVLISTIVENHWLGQDTKWTEVRYRTMWWPVFFNKYHYKLKGVEYIDENYYWKVYCGDRETGKMREDKEGNIYYREQQTDNGNNISKEFLLYSFGKEPWKIGDKIRYAGEWDADGVKEVEHTITYLENYTLINGEVVPATITNIGFLIYGIGNTTGIVEGIYPQPTDGSQAALYEYYQKGELLYRNKSVGIEPVNASTQLMIRNEGNSVIFKQIATNSNASLLIYNISGQNIGIYPMTDNEVIINHLPAGIYLYRLSSTTHEETGRFVILVK